MESSGSTETAENTGSNEAIGEDDLEERDDSACREILGYGDRCIAHLGKIPTTHCKTTRNLIVDVERCVSVLTKPVRSGTVRKLRYPARVII